MAPYRILVVDDSAFMRKLIADLISQDPQFVVASTARNGMEAIDAVRRWQPDAITMDLEMPEMNGLEALKAIMRLRPTPVIMIAGVSEEGARETIKALQYGAFDFIRKPVMGKAAQDIQDVSDQLLEKLRFAVKMKRHHPIWELPETPGKLEAAASKQPPLAPPAAPAESSARLGRPEADAKPKRERKGLDPGPGPKPPVKPRAERMPPAVGPAIPKSAAQQPTKPGSLEELPPASFKDIVLIGTSTGGPRALHQVLTGLPKQFPAPVLVVQHMPPKFTHSLAQRLDSYCAIQVKEAEQGERLRSGVAYIAPGGLHMELHHNSNGYFIALDGSTPARMGHRPSVDVLFESAVRCSGLRRHAVIMTGMGSDGMKGLQALRQGGAETAIAEAEETCIVFGMPRSAIEGGATTHILPLPQIAERLIAVVAQSQTGAVED